MSIPDVVRQIADVATLEDPVRRTLYFFVAGAPQPVTRDAAARAARVSRPLAAFHLDKLVAAGLLEATYRRLTRRGGSTRAGRPAKLYRRSSRQVELSLPQRRYELAARLLAESLVTAPDPATVDAVRAAARQFGTRLGLAARDRAGARPGKTRLLASASALLRDYGFEPVQERQTIRLRNCPFDALARDYRSLVCGMNLALMEGLLAGLEIAGIEAELDPQPGMCCVQLRRPKRPGASPRA